MARTDRITRASSALAALLIAAPAAAQFETTEVSGPGSSAPLLLTRTGWQWQDLAPTVPGVTYNVYRRQPADGGFRCLQSNLASPGWGGDPASPPPGEAWWYTVDADDTWGENLHGSQLPIVERCPCSGPPPVAGTDVRLEMVGWFDTPVLLTSPPADPSRLFVVQQAGAIRIIKRGVELTTPFLDISSRVVCCSEQGLLGLAFHPDYASNGRFFVNYTAPGGSGDGITHIEEYQVSGDPDVADPTPVGLVFSLDQPAFNHNAGMLAFGPTDGYLYIALGDGGSSSAESQQLDSFFGTILRVDVDSGSPYAIPADNPFVSTPGALGEIWSYGLRNPWRFSFDRATGDMYIGDVGAGCFEEVSVGLAADGGGENFGWDLLEGEHCRDGSCATTTLCAGCAGVSDCSQVVPPVLEIPQDDPPNPRNCSVIGGYVYRGCRMPDLRGTYFYSDWCGSFMRSFELAGRTATNLLDWSAAMPEVNWPSSFGDDARGELYIVSLNGSIHRFVPN